MKPSNMIKCRYCAWQTPRWSRTKSGKRTKRGEDRLSRHVVMVHEDEYVPVLRRLMEEDVLDEWTLEDPHD